MNFQDYILFLFGAFVKFRKKMIFSFVMSVHPSVCPNETNRLQLDGFSLNLIFDFISTICRENSSFIEIWQEWWVLYMKTNVHFLSYLSQFFLEWKIFKTMDVEKLEIFILFSLKIFFRKWCSLWDNVENCGRDGQVTDTIWCMHIIHYYYF
jgi:hypothetical protein